MPTFCYLKEGHIIERSIARPTDEVIPGVPWGSPEMLFTPAFWLAQYWMREGTIVPRVHSLGRTLEEEVVACLLGGHGIPAEIALAAFYRLRTRGLISRQAPQSEEISQNLREPLTISGRRVRYRFWSQKARYIAIALRTCLLYTSIYPLPRCRSALL